MQSNMMNGWHGLSASSERLEGRQGERNVQDEESGQWSVREGVQCPPSKRSFFNEFESKNAEKLNGIQINLGERS